MAKSLLVARGGLLVAVSLVLLYIGVIMPTIQISVCVIAGVVPAMPLSRKQVRLAMTVFCATALLGWALMPSKSSMCIYTVVGLYALVKYALERYRKRVLEWICKLLYCNASLVLFLLALRVGLFPTTHTLTGVGILLFAVLFDLVFVVFDFAFSKLIAWLQRIYPK